VGVLASPSPLDGKSGLHPTGRSRGKLLPATHGETRLRGPTTSPNQSPRILGRFTALRIAFKKNSKRRRPVNQFTTAA
jgi:hypothetical protein